MEPLIAWRLAKGKVFAACDEHGRRVFRNGRDANVPLEAGFRCEWPGCEARAVREYWPGGARVMTVIEAYIKGDPTPMAVRVILEPYISLEALSEGYEREGGAGMKRTMRYAFRALVESRVVR